MENKQKKDNRLSIYYARFEIEPQPGEVIIYENNKSWNDFGHQVQCGFSANLQDNDTNISGDILLGFLPTSPHSLKDLRQTDKIVISTKDMNTFYTLLPEIQAYRNIVNKLGLDSANDFLFQLNDLVRHKEDSSSQIWLNEAVNTEAFKLAFMRNSEPFFAFHNAGSVLDGIGFEDFQAISTDLSLIFQLDGFTNQHKVRFKFESGTNSLVPKRINILIGKNGLGKSQVLKQFCRSALRYKNEKNNLTDTSKDIERPMINRLLAIGTPGETANTFPAERIGKQKLYYRRLNLTRKSKAATSRGVGETLVQLARSDDTIGSKSRWNLFWDALANVMTVGELTIDLKNTPTEKNKTIDLDSLKRLRSEQSSLELWSNIEPNSEPKVHINNKYYPLSSGQLTFFKFALLCCLHIENGSFVLMDEPETHLHPNLIADFVELLDFILEHTGSQAIIATHSAYFVKEVTREQVHVFKRDENGNLSIDPPRLKTFGSDVDSISQFVFGEDTESRLTNKIIKRIQNRSFASIDKELSGEISLAALMDIRRRMEKLI